MVGIDIAIEQGERAVHLKEVVGHHVKYLSGKLSIFHADDVSCRCYVPGVLPGDSLLFSSGLT